MDRCITALLFFIALRLPAADGDRTVVPMHLNLNVPAFSGQSIDFGLSRDAKVIAERGASRYGKVAGLTVHATSLADKSAYSVLFTSPDGQATTVEVAAGASARVEIRRLAGVLSYNLTYAT